MSLVPVVTHSSVLEAELLLATFVLCSLIGLERQSRQKSAGYRTHVLVGLGACSFTIVSGFGFTLVLGQEVNLDPSRIAAQVVSGIGFLGAGVIFKGGDVVRGLTTAATIWQSAAVGMACGAGMLSLAVLLTVLHLVTLYVVAPLMRRVPNADRKRVLRVTYLDGHGVLRDILALASSTGFASTIERSHRRSGAAGPTITMDIRFLGRLPVRDLVPPLMQLDGVEDIALRDAAQDDDGDGD
ncbi:MgtC/SapB family protein [Nakamurella endophytica]|uniref:Membrane protein n=1 Tax=Nakamurella endophytica TaxID=1748367 RepID=A0A917T3Y0_9ACTN|nr:MgtC/SapB family protein [Nakamurella endophytica]GGM08342.1 membrane protein [Nakamurella endophytica]